jgi:hypothetical protein
MTFGLDVGFNHVNVRCNYEIHWFIAVNSIIVVVGSCNVKRLVRCFPSQLPIYQTA